MKLLTQILHTVWRHCFVELFILPSSSLYFGVSFVFTSHASKIFNTGKVRRKNDVLYSLCIDSNMFKFVVRKFAGTKLFLDRTAILNVNTILNMSNKRMFFLISSRLDQPNSITCYTTTLNVVI